MAEITTQQLAQILLGVARAQGAVVEAIENSKAGFKATHLRPSLETAARIKANRPETLSDYPSRLLLQIMGRGAPDLDTVVRDVGNLLGAPPAPPPARTPAETPAPALTPPSTPGDDENSLDMTR